MAASEIVMIRPCSFGYNAETATSNHFQNEHSSAADVQEMALGEFDNMVATLEKKGVTVKVYNDSPEPHTPDSIFPNNWFATHHDGTIVLFPMEAENRRLERREDLINDFEVNYECSRIIDFTDAENIDVFLEGTGSIVFDHDNSLAYACSSSRTDERLFRDYCESIDYSAVIFDARDDNDRPIYHTNVLMNVGKNYVVICSNAIDAAQRGLVLTLLKRSGKRVIEISHEQMNQFAGNMLELQGKDGLITVLSQAAFEALEENQKNIISATSELTPIAVPTIESIGGGSVRCMMAEVYLSKF